ncbi:MAG: alpha/beta fold hydrolase [Planctomycetes bacterium]|nr:alpha/beta fold hydrolase [Planctomycetota bacterium]MCB9883980.1 alpha/beta fold hydrolase [Planctomycetota bacterium]
MQTIAARCHQIALCLAAFLLADASLTAAPQQPGRAEKRTYFFEDAKQDIEYRLYVPKSYDKEKATPLIVLLHGLGSTPHQVIGYQGITTEAEKRGYIVVAPYGYNSRGWYGSRGEGKEGPFFGTRSDPDNLGALSQKDVMNVLGIVEKEFHVDADRVYLMGHSMGGAGTIHLATEFPDRWAALAPLAPALDDKTSRLEKIRHLPVQLVMGDQDRMVPVAVVRKWAEEMKRLKMDYRYEEIPGGDHVTAIARNAEMITKVFDFFDSKKRAAKATKGADKAPEPQPVGK